MALPSWRNNLKRRGGFWRNGNWFDLHLERRMPLVIPMLEEMVTSLPPLDATASVCDLACGTGNTSLIVLSAYPGIQLTLIDEDVDLLSIARDKLSVIREDVTLINASISAEGEPLPGGPYDVVLASLALHSIIGHDMEPPEAESRYELLFQSVSDSLLPGGHIIVGDHVGTLGLFRQLKALERAGFVDVDCAWRQDDFFVCGGRIPA